jgi:choline dehydrogenase
VLFELVAGLHSALAERFRGIDGIRVADASLMPSIVSGNTMATVYGIAERAVSLMQE